MNFIQKLTKDTLSGMWDYDWKYSDGAKSYTFNLTKHYLSGLTFSIDKDPGAVVFPNGLLVRVEGEDLIGLRDACDVSLKNTFEDSVKRYMSGEVVEDVSGGESDTQTDINVDHKNKDSINSDGNNPVKDEVNK